MLNMAVRWTGPGSWVQPVRFGPGRLHYHICILEESPPAKAGFGPARSARTDRPGPVGPARSAPAVWAPAWAAAGAPAWEAHNPGAPPRGGGKKG